MTRNILLEWRRSNVLELLSKGYNQYEISKLLHVDKSTISRDVTYIMEQAKERIKEYEDRLPFECERYLTGLDFILKEALNISQNANDSREKINAFSLAKECIIKRFDLFTNGNILNEVLKIIPENKSEINNIKSINNIKHGNNIYKVKEQNDIKGSEENSRSEESTYNKQF